jgi:hypothetical protein
VLALYIYLDVSLKVYRSPDNHISSLDSLGLLRDVNIYTHRTLREVH